MLDASIPSQNIPRRPKQDSSILVDIGFLSRKKKLKPSLEVSYVRDWCYVTESHTHSTSIINMLAEQTNIANGTKRAGNA